MSFSIENNYSVLNNYHYQKKPFLSSSLDWLSTPCRRVLGGRNIYVLSQTYENKMSMVGKIVTVFFSVLIFPVAVVSITSLIIKLATFPWIWEKRKVKIQSQQIWDILNQFNQAFQIGDYEKAIQSFKQREEILRRSDVYPNVFKIINQKINNNDSWENIQKLLSIIQVEDAIELINYAIKVKLSAELKNDRHFISPKNLISFIQHSLKSSTITNIEACYKKVLSHSLQIDINENILLTAFKMNLADHMIKSLIHMKTFHAKNELECTMVKLDENLLRYIIFKKEQDYLNDFAIFNSPDSMEKVNLAVQNIRDINQIGWESLDKLNALSTHPSISQQQWNEVQSELKQFQNFLNGLTSSSVEEEKKYIQAIQMILNHLIKLTNLIWNRSSAQELKTLATEIETNFAQQVKTFQNLFTDTKVSYLQIYSDNLLSTLRLKKRADLFMFTEKMKSFLLSKSAQALQSVIK